jgi:hypothetical protein
MQIGSQHFAQATHNTAQGSEKFTRIYWDDLY